MDFTDSDNVNQFSVRVPTENEVRSGYYRGPMIPGSFIPSAVAVPLGYQGSEETTDQTNGTATNTADASTIDHPPASSVVIPAQVEETQSPTKVGLSAEDLKKRDQEAIDYTKSLLLDGDTVVYIKYPGNVHPVDSMGFELFNQPHRVHSQFLLETGSGVFAEMLGPTKQFRTIRRLKLVNRLPPGAKYVLDLTPPEEGDDAVELTANLSCSFGIRMWYMAEFRCGISNNLVGGTEPSLPNQGKRLSTVSAVSGASEMSDDSTDATEPPISRTMPVDAQIAIAINRSRTEFNNSKAHEPEIREVPEYCPIRHRIGIQNLLQLVEGRDIRLDSAPKVWTMYVLAKYFECETLVRDRIVSWMIAFPNSHFIEILPEKSLEIGYGLKLEPVTKMAFAVLVSEEALSIITRSCQPASQFDQRNTSPFGRRREDLNEDLKRPIEYASKVFAERISKICSAVIDPKVVWLQALPEFAKLSSFEDQLISNCKDERVLTWLNTLYQLVDKLRHFVRGRIFAILIQRLSKEEENTANEHRSSEQYFASKPDPPDFGTQYAVQMSIQERMFTVYFWRALKTVGFDATCPTNLIIDTPNAYNTSIALQYNIHKITKYDLRTAVRDLSDSMMEAIAAGFYSNNTSTARAPVSTTSPSLNPTNVQQPDSQDSADVQTDQETVATASGSSTTTQGSMEYLSIPIRQRDTSTIFSGVLPGRFDENNYNSKSASTRSLYDAQVASDTSQSAPLRPPTEHLVRAEPSLPTTDPPLDRDIGSDSLFFSLSELLFQANWHVQDICNRMLDLSSLAVDIACTDTLLCLGPEELKYLPLWAGGDDDDSGGVFDPSIPFASAGPNGPGPSFHTGISTVSSATMSDFDDQMSSIHTSTAVEDGFSDHIDRRRVVADDDMHSETFSESSELYTDRGVSPSMTATSATMDVVDSDDLDALTLSASDHMEDEDVQSFVSDADTENGNATNGAEDVNIIMDDDEFWMDAGEGASGLDNDDLDDDMVLL